MAAVGRQVVEELEGQVEPEKAGSSAPLEVWVTSNVTYSPWATVALTSGLLDVTEKVCEASRCRCRQGGPGSPAPRAP